MILRPCRVGWFALAVILAPAVLHGRGDDSAPPVEGALAWQGEAVVTLRDVDARLARIPEDVRGDVMDSPQRIEEVVGGLLVNRQLAARAEELDLHDDPDVAAELAIIREEVLARRFLEHAVGESPEADMEALAREEYLGNRSRYSNPGGKRVSHILVSTSERGDADAEVRAEEVLAKLKSGELSFAEAVRSYSDDPSHRTNLGAVGVVGENFDPAFRAAAEKLEKPGELSGAVRSQFGFHVIRLDAIEEARQLTFDEVRASLIARIQSDSKARKRLEIVEGVRALPLNADPDLVYSLRTRYRATSDEDSRP